MALNWSAGFGGAAEGLKTQGLVHAQQDVEKMRDARAENMARLQQERQFAHDEALSTRREQHDERVAHQQDVHTEMVSREHDAAQRQMNQDYLQRLGVLQGAEGARADARQSSAEKIANQRLIAQNRLDMARALGEHDGRIDALYRDIRIAAEKNPDFAAIKDPKERNAAMASDPVIGPMLGQLVEARNEKRKAQTLFILNGVQLGDTGFKGFTPDQVPKPPIPSSLARTPGLPGVSTPGTEGLLPSTTGAGSNPPSPLIPQGQQDTPDATAAPAFGGAAPSVDAQGPAPQVAQPQVLGPRRPPTTTLQGPLQMPNQLIPTNQDPAQQYGASGNW